MQYKQKKKGSEKISILGFGCMRLPTSGKYADIDEAEAAEMVSWAIEHGVNYIDTAYMYHGGNSERFLGRFLKNGLRDKIYLATKLPLGRVETPDDFDRLLDEQLEKLQTDHLDFYMFHAINKKQWDRLRPMGLLEWVEKRRGQGDFKYLGFSFHDNYQAFKEIIDGHDRWDFCQIQYNYMNEEVQAGTKGLEYAGEKGIDVIIMEPLLGGNLVDPPKQVNEVWKKSEIKRTPAEWALQWLWDKPQILNVLSGMSTMEQVKENVEAADSASEKRLSQTDLKIVEQVRNTYDKLQPIPCTGCKYCVPCPSEVNIPQIFSIYNTGIRYNRKAQAGKRYWKLKEGKADLCIECGDCLEKCPQGIDITGWLKKVHKELTAV
ncbi:MAG: aldo/keto reductase [Spirochaetia bacterium]